MSSQFPSGAGNALTGAVQVKTVSYVVLSTDIGTWIVMNSASPQTITLLATIPTGAPFILGVLNVGTGALTVNPNGKNINAAAGSLPLSQNEGAVFSTDYSNYFTVPPQSFPVFGASGINHSSGAVPDPGSTAGTTRFLCENGGWVTLGGGGVPVASSRTTASVTTGSLAPSGVQTGTITLAKTFVLMYVQVSAPARVRLYATAAARTADASRGTGVAPPAGTQYGIISDLYLTTAQYFLLSPVAVGSNGDGSPASGSTSNSIYYSITNIGASAAAITVTFTYLLLEV